MAQFVLQQVTNVVDFGMNVQHADATALFHHKVSTSPTWEGEMTDGSKLELESGLRAEVVRELQNAATKFTLPVALLVVIKQF
jgi:gamma-glutamyltranspeptidase